VHIFSAAESSAIRRRKAALLSEAYHAYHAGQACTTEVVEVTAWPTAVTSLAVSDMSRFPTLAAECRYTRQRYILFHSCLANVRALSHKSHLVLHVVIS
jgi:hypothetical protein